MGFAKKSRKEAKRRQEEAMAMQRQAYADSQRMAQEYQNSFNTRNAGILGLQKQATDWLANYNAGTDVSKLNPAFAKYAQETAGQVQSTMQVANRLGDRMGGDKDYQAKLNSLATRNIASQLAGLQEQSLMSELNNQRGILMDTSNFLNQDSRAGFGMQSELFGMTNSIFNNATTKRNMEIQRSNMMMNNLMQGIAGGISAFSAVGGFGGISSLFGGGASAAGGAGNLVSNSAVANLNAQSLGRFTSRNFGF